MEADTALPPARTAPPPAAPAGKTCACCTPANASRASPSPAPAATLARMVAGGGFPSASYRLSLSPAG